ncbi:hypothetical protein [Luteibacter yeojuensis]
MAPFLTAALRCAPILIAGCTTGTSAAAPSADMHPIARFDQAIAAGLPRAVPLPGPASLSRGTGATSGLVVEAHLDVGVRFVDGASGEMYLATWQGEPAVVTRSGDHLDITVAHHDGVSVTGFDGDSDAVHIIESTDDNAATGATKATAARHARRRRDTDGGPPAAPHLQKASPRPTLTFWMFLHDDTLDMDRKHIHARYVAWWIADMAKILPTRKLWAIYSQQVENVTDMAYGHEASLRDWTTIIDFYQRRNELPYVPGKFEYKFMLITSDEPMPGVTGLAWLGGEEAIASLSGRYSIVAHEYGHTLAAVHDDAEVRWSSAWPCETNLVATTAALRSNCYHYSTKNERNMRVHLAREWTMPVGRDSQEIPLLCK